MFRKAVRSIMLCLFLMAGMSLCTMEAEADSRFTINEDGTISRYSGTDSVLVIPEEIDGIKVKAIGNNAFWECASLTQVTIPEGVTRIGDNAFYSCTALTEISIPEGITSIGQCAFQGCTELTRMIIPEGVSTIRTGTFYNCRKMTEISIPSSLTYVDVAAFSWCESLKRVNIQSIEGFLSTSYESAYSNPMCYGADLYIDGELVTDAIVPGRRSSVPKYGFYGCTSLKRVTIEPGVKSVNERAFQFCTNLTEAVLPNSVTSFGDYAFNGCSSLTKVTVPGFVVQGSSSAGGKYTFPYYFGTGIPEIVIADGVSAVGKNAFNGCAGLTSVTFSDSVTSIGATAFKGCTEMEEVVIPDYVTSIGADAFEKTTVIMSTPGAYARKWAEENGYTWKCSYPQSAHPYANNSDITWTYRHSSAAYALMVSFSEDTRFEEDRDYLYVTGQDGVQNRYTHRELKEYSVVLKGSSFTLRLVTNGDTTAYGFKVESISAMTQEEYDRYMYYSSVFTMEPYSSNNLNGYTGIITGYSGNEEELSIPKIIDGIKVKRIGRRVFKGHQELRQVVIPEGVSTIDSEAFSGCSALIKVELPESLREIRDSAFSSCSSLQSISVPEGVTSIEGNAFYACKSLENITLPSGACSVSSHAFYGCKYLRRVMIKGSERPNYHIPPISPNSGYYNITICCYRSTDVAEWANEKGYRVKYLDDLDSPIAFTLAAADSSIVPGAQTVLYPMVFPEREIGELTWESSSPEVAQVENGVVTALSLGQTTIRTTYSGLEASIDIIVYKAAESFELSAGEMWITVGEQATLEVGNILPLDADCKWMTGELEEEIVDVNNAGDEEEAKWLVKGAAPGQINITVADEYTGDFKACTVYVYPAVTKIELSAQELFLLPEETAQITACVMAGNQTVENKLISFENSDETVATVTAEGMITAQKIGIAVVTAKAASGTEAKCMVFVGAQEKIILPAMLTEIGAEAFAGTDVVEIHIPEGVTSIGDFAFGGCQHLQIAEIPSSVTYIADNAFDGCPQLQMLVEAGSRAEQFAIDQGISYMVK